MSKNILSQASISSFASEQNEKFFYEKKDKIEIKKCVHNHSSDGYVKNSKEKFGKIIK